VVVIISVRLHPNATKNELVGFSDGVWVVKISAPPVKGKANKELISFLSKVLGVGKSSVSIAQGHTSRSKLIAVDGLSQQEIMKRLSSFVSSR
jgi:uncharacterized protein (TIGR00251 family)